MSKTIPLKKKKEKKKKENAILKLYPQHNDSILELAQVSVKKVSTFPKVKLKRKQKHFLTKKKKLPILWTNDGAGPSIEFTGYCKFGLFVVVLVSCIFEGRVSGDELE